MFIVLLKFAANKHLANEWMDAHNIWIKQGFEQKIFLLVGSIKSGLGGAILVNGCSREMLESIVSADPFVQQSIVQPEIYEISPAKWDERLQVLFN